MIHDMAIVTIQFVSKTMIVDVSSYLINNFAKIIFLKIKIFFIDNLFDSILNVR